MALAEELNSSRKKLFDKLGDNSKLYCQLMKQWFSMKMTKEEFDIEARKMMNPDQTRLHNDFLLCLLNKCSFANTEPSTSRHNGKKAKSVKPKRSSDKGAFQPADPALYLPQLEAPPQKLQEDSIRYSVQDYFLPDQSFLLGRLMLGAWELGLKGADDNTAECLVIAVQYFLKNVLTAVVTMRKGYKVRNKGYIHSIGTPVANPWLRNSRKRRISTDNGYLETLEENEELGSVMYATPRPPMNSSDAEQQEAFDLACASYATDTPNDRISTYDILLGLMVHKSSVPAHSIYAHNMERIICSLNHPTWEEMEAAKHFPNFT